MSFASVLGPGISKHVSFAQLLIDPIKKHVGYIFSSTKLVRNMSTKIKQLDATSHDIEKHMSTNRVSNLEIPSFLPDWLEEVKKIKEDAESISSNGNGCCNMKGRYIAGRNAFKVTMDIERLIRENLENTWTDSQIPPGEVKYERGSTSSHAGSNTQTDFKSRERTFKDALEFLQKDHENGVMALCGMGGVGKTVMMEQLKSVVKDRKMFDNTVSVLFGQNANVYSIQQAIAEYTGKPLTEMTKTARADQLCNRFEELSKRGKRTLVMLDDVWDMVELKDIGLNPFPKGVKLLLTSRYGSICTQIAVQTNFVCRLLTVNALEESEARNFFFQITGEENDLKLNEIGGKIVRSCGFLPLAIKLIATTLKHKEEYVWSDTLRRLLRKDIDSVLNVVEISYGYIKEEEDKRILLLCGLFLEDSNIPIEDLTRYAWGLGLLNGVATLGEARDRTKTCVRNLKDASLLMDSDYPGCVKMHDLVLAYVLLHSRVDHAWVINHGDSSNQSGVDKRNDVCERVSLTCMGMSEFPVDLNYPNLSFLKLMHGDKSLTFPEDFYEKIGDVEVIVYDKMQCPLLPTPLQCSTNLRTLCLSRCLLMFDCSSIGDLLNLEVLSFANCRMRKLPSTIRNLKKQKLLDLTGCVDLCVDAGVLSNLNKLEELYMRVASESSIRFTHDNYNELAECSKSLSALEIEFFDNNVVPKNMSFEKLINFKISMGSGVERSGDEGKYSLEILHSFENMLMLTTSEDYILKSRIHELFEKTHVLHLEIHEVENLHILTKSQHPRQHSFNNLRVLDVTRCGQLKYLFTVPFASGLTKLERLTVSDCPVMKVLVLNEQSEAVAITFQKLKFLSLDNLQGLQSLCNSAIKLPHLVTLVVYSLPNFTSIYPENKSATASTSNIVSERRPLLNEKVMAPMLEKLKIYRMEKLKEIWPCQITSNVEVNSSMLRYIEVSSCRSLVNLFPCNPMPVIQHLEELQVSGCGNIEVLFNMDLERFGEIDEGSSSLRRIVVYTSYKLREVWRIKVVHERNQLIRGFEAVEKISINRCPSFRNVFTPTTANFDLRAVAHILINGSLRSMDLFMQRYTGPFQIMTQRDEDILTVAFSPYLINTFHHLHRIILMKNDNLEVIFAIGSQDNREVATLQKNQQPSVFPYLEDLKLVEMVRMTHVWKCHWNKFLIPHKQEPISAFHNLRSIYMTDCHSINYLFSPLMAKLLVNLKEIKIERCKRIEQIVSDRDDKYDEMVTFLSTNTNATLFSHLDSVVLSNLICLKEIGGGKSSGVTLDQFQGPQATDDLWYLCQYSRKIDIYNCNLISSLIPFEAIHSMQKLESLRVTSLESMTELFETQRANNIRIDVCEGSNGDSVTTTTQWSTNVIEVQLPNLKTLHIRNCNRLRDVFNFSTLESLKRLEEFHVEYCDNIEVIVKEEGGDHVRSKDVSFRSLKSLKLVCLPNLNGFFLGQNNIEWPLLDTVVIKDWPKMTRFTHGHSTSPELKYIHAALGKYKVECGLNFDLTSAFQEFSLTRFYESRSFPLLDRILMPFSNLLEMKLYGLHDLRNIIIPSKELLQWQNLEKIIISDKSPIEEIFEAFEGNNGLSKLPVLEFPKLREVELFKLDLKHIRWTVLKFPNLTRLSIDNCDCLEYVFTSSMVGNLMQLQELHIVHCSNVEVIVKEVEVQDPTRVNEVEFRCLKSLELLDLQSMKGFCLGRQDFQWPSLDTLDIKYCPKIVVFTNGNPTTPKLKTIDTKYESIDAMENPNFFIMTLTQEGFDV